MAQLLSADFTLDMACKSQTAARCAIDNTPRPEVIPRLAAVATAILQPIFEYYGQAQVSSWFRCKALNMAVGGAEESQHMRGEAVDVEVPGVPTAELAQWVIANLPFDQVILEHVTPGQPHSGWVHVSHIDESAADNIAAGRKNRRDILTITKAGTQTGLHI